MEVRLSPKSLHQLAELVNGRVVGNAVLEISDALPLQDATAACITLADSAKQLARVNRSPASAVVVSQELVGCSKPQLIVANIHDAFQTIIGVLRIDGGGERGTGVSVAAHVHASARVGATTTISAGSSVGAGSVLGERCTVHPGVHIMAGCRIGNECELFPGVVLYPSTHLGDRVVIHANATIGAYGFGYRTSNGVRQRCAQLGWVEIGDDVEIGTCTAVDRGTYGPTKIGDGTKIDNMVQIAHNCQIGKHNLLCAQVGVAGSCTTGDYVVMAGQAGLADHINLGQRVIVGGKAGVMQDVEDDQTVFGSPACESKRKMQEVALVARLPEMRNELRNLQKQIKALTAQLSNDAQVKTTAAEANGERHAA